MMFLITDSFSDCTNIYDVSLEGRTYTIGEFIQEIFSKRSNEWGIIEIKDVDTINYRDGETIPRLDNEILDKKVRKVIAHGGWSRMDYTIYL